MNKPKILRPEDWPTAMTGAGDEYTFLATGKETGGSYFMMHGLVPPGGGPPPHIQTREEEGFYVLEGTVTFWVDGERHEAETGTLLHVPRGVPHCFKNESDSDARMLIWFGPAGVEGMFTEMAAAPENVPAIGAKYGVDFVEMPTPEA